MENSAKKTKKKNFIQEAEQNLVNICKTFDDILLVFDALRTFGDRYCHEYVGKSEFFEGLKMMRKAIYHEQAEAIRNCFVFVGVGGETAAKYSKEKFKEIFCSKKRYSIMQFLDKFGQLPSWYSANDHKEFRKQGKEICSEIEKNEKTNNKNSTSDVFF